MTKLPTTLISAALLALPLASCGTHYGAALAQAGTTSARPANDVLTIPGRTYGLYKIGDAYYAQVDFEYLPVRYYEYTWDATLQYSPRSFPASKLDPQTCFLSVENPEKAVFYCPYRADDAKACAALGIPVPVEQDGTVLPLLSEAEAEQAGATLVRTFSSPPFNAEGQTLLPQSIRDDIPDHTTALHYAALPAAGAAYVLVDIPATVVGSSLYVLESVFDVITIPFCQNSPFSQSW